MMVAFQYDNGAVGSLYYSREIPSLFRGLRHVEAVRPRRRHHVRIERRCSSSCAGAACRALILPGLLRDIRGYQAMYRDFLGAIRDRRAPEMSLERAMEDQRLMDQVVREPSAAGSRSPSPEPTRFDRSSFDIVIIGSGAGGGTMAHALAATRRAHPARRARRLRAAGRRELDPAAVWKDLRYRTAERWLDERRPASSGRTRTTASAATRSSGAACSTGCGARTSARSQHADGVSPAWPIDYETLAPYYDRAERLYQRARRSRATIRPSRRAARFRTRRSRTRRGMARDRRASCASWGCTRRRCRSA